MKRRRRPQTKSVLTRDPGNIRKLGIDRSACIVAANIGHHPVLTDRLADNAGKHRPDC